MSSSTSNGVTTYSVKYEVDSAQAQEMQAYAAYLLGEDNFYILEDENPDAFAVLARNSADEGQCLVLTILCDDTGYAITIVKDAGRIDTPGEPTQQEQTTAPPENTTRGERVTSAFFEWTQWDQEALELADQCLEVLRDKEWGAFGSFVHRKQGLTFSPYGYVEDGAVRLGMGDAKALGTYSKVHTWGHYYGSSEPIEMTFVQYYDRFIFDHDFTQAPIVSVDKIVKTTREDNLYVFGNGGVFVEYHIPGSGADADRNWASLRLVFSWEEDVEGLSLVAVVHDEWTPSASHSTAGGTTPSPTTTTTATKPTTTPKPSSNNSKLVGHWQYIESGYYYDYYFNSDGTNTLQSTIKPLNISLELTPMGNT